MPPYAFFVMRNAAKLTFSTFGATNGFPEILSTNIEAPAGHDNTRSKGSSLQLQFYYGSNGSSLQLQFYYGSKGSSLQLQFYYGAPNQSSFMEEAIRARTRSTISILGNRHWRPRGKGPSNAEFDAGR